LVASQGDLNASSRILKVRVSDNNTRGSAKGADGYKDLIRIGVSDVFAGIVTVVSNGSPNRTGLIASRSSGLVEAERQSGIKIRGNVIINSERLSKGT